MTRLTSLVMNRWLQRLTFSWPLWIVQPFLAFSITRFVIFCGGYLAAVALPDAADPGSWHAAPNNLLLDIWARWDSGFYLGIVDTGYAYTPGQMGSVAFFPVYPLLVSLLKILTGNTLLAGVLVSNASLFWALVVLYRLALIEFGDEGVAQRAVYYIAAFPTAFFFSAVYTESTFLCAAVATFYFARTQKWGWAGVCGLITSATRIVGVIMLAVVMLEWLRFHGWTLATLHRRTAWYALWQGIRNDWQSLLAIVTIPLGLLSYMLFLQMTFSDPVAFWSVQAAWGRQALGPLAVIWHDLSTLLGQNFLTGDIWWNVAIDLSALALALALTPIIWRRLGASYALYTVLGMLIPVSSGSGSLSRYIVVLFPVFLILAVWGHRPAIDRLITISFTLLLGILTAGFVNWFFVA